MVDRTLITRCISGICWILLFFFSTYSSYAFTIWKCCVYGLCIYEITKLSQLKYLCIMIILICFYSTAFDVYEKQIYYYAMMISVITDTGCYISGKLFGKHHFTSISPNKTIEGLIGGLLLIMLIFHNLQSLTLYLCAVIGDLFFSWIKRKNNIKDFSNILPGHGGILDRIDSLIMCILFIQILQIKFSYVN